VGSSSSKRASEKGPRGPCIARDIATSSWTSRPPSSRSDSPIDVPGALAPLLEKLDTTKGPKPFAAMVSSLEISIRAVLEEGNPTSVWLVRRALDEIAAEPEGFGGATRAVFARPLLALFYDPKLLAAVAEKSLDGIEDRGRRASSVVVRAGKAGVYALYTARLKHPAFDARQRFIANVLDIGAPALGILCAGLEKLESRLALPGAQEIVEDLLLALPAALDAASTEIVIRYTRSEVTTIALAASAALKRSARP